MMRGAAGKEIAGLLDGAKSPAYLQRALDLLAGVLPDQRRVRIPDVSHNAPDMEAPRVIAEQIAAFFAAPARGRGAVALSQRAVRGRRAGAA